MYFSPTDTAIILSFVFSVANIPQFSTVLISFIAVLPTSTIHCSVYSSLFTYLLIAFICNEFLLKDDRNVFIISKSEYRPR